MLFMLPYRGVLYSIGAKASAKVVIFYNLTKYFHLFTQLFLSF